MEIDLLSLNSDSFNSFCNHINQHISILGLNLSRQRCPSNMFQQRNINLLLQLKPFQEFQRLIPSFFISISDNPWVNPILNKSLGLRKQISNHKNVGSCSIANNIVLSCGCSGYHSGCWVTNLHFFEENISIFCELYLTCTSY